MAFDNNEFDDDSGVFDIFFVETEEGHIVKTSQDIAEEKAAEEALAEEISAEETPVEELPAEPEEAPTEPEEAPVESEEAPAEPEETPVESEEAPAEPEEVLAEPEEVLEEPDEEMDIPEELTDDFDADDDIIEEDVAAALEEAKKAPEEVSEEALEVAEAEADEEPEEENDIPDSLKTLTEVKQEKGDEKETSWGTADGEANEPYIAVKSKKIFGIGYSGFSIVIAAIFAIDAILFNFIAHWGSYWVSCKVLHAIGIEALKLSEAKFEKFTIMTAYILALVVGGALLFLLMWLATKLMLEAEFEEGKEVVRITVGFLLLLFIIGSVIAMISAKSVFVFATFRWLAPVAAYGGGLLIYALSTLKFNQDY